MQSCNVDYNVGNDIDFSFSPVYQEGAIYLPVYDTGYLNEIELLKRNVYYTLEESLRFIESDLLNNPRILVIAPGQIPYLVGLPCKLVSCVK
jgi:hypothetical protein